MTEKELRKKAMALPLQPGVYIMKNKDKKIIYIGKAKKLKNRVSQYFGSHTNHSLKVIKMVENADDFDYILCDSRIRDQLLEALRKEITRQFGAEPLANPDYGKIINEKHFVI